MYIETRHYDNGHAVMQMFKYKTSHKTEETAMFDRYVEEVDDLQEWIKENLRIKVASDIKKIISSLENGETVSITKYI
jgi:hypothetical protein